MKQGRGARHAVVRIALRLEALVDDAPGGVQLPGQELELRDSPGKLSRENKRLSVSSIPDPQARQGDTKAVTRIVQRCTGLPVRAAVERQRPMLTGIGAPLLVGAAEKVQRAAELSRAR